MFKRHTSSITQLHFKNLSANEGSQACVKKLNHAPNDPCSPFVYQTLQYTLHYAYILKQCHMYHVRRCIYNTQITRHVGPTWSRQNPRWANVGSTKFAIGDSIVYFQRSYTLQRLQKWNRGSMNMWRTHDYINPVSRSLISSMPVSIKCICGYSLSYK